MQHKVQTLPLGASADNIMDDVVLVAMRTLLPIHQFVSYINDLFHLSLSRKKDINIAPPDQVKATVDAWLLPFFVYDDEINRLRYALVTVPAQEDKYDVLFFNCYLYISGENANAKARKIHAALTEDDLRIDEPSKFKTDLEQLRREVRDLVFKADYFCFRQPDAPETSYFGSDTNMMRQKNSANYMRLLYKFSKNVLNALLSLIWGGDESFSTPDSTWEKMLDENMFDIKITTIKSR